MSPLTTSITLSFNNIKNGDFLVPANPGPPGQMAVKAERVQVGITVIIPLQCTRRGGMSAAASRPTDREVGHVAVRYEPVARLELDGGAPVADEPAVVDDGRALAAVVADADAVTVVEDELRTRDLGALVARVAHRAVVQRPRLVHRHVHAVAEVVAERRPVEDAPAALIRDVDAVVPVVVDCARVHQNVSYIRTHAPHVIGVGYSDDSTAIRTHNVTVYLK